jgi:hypothetical protein
MAFDLKNTIYKLFKLMFNKNNYKNLVLFLIFIIFVMLFIGNYNLTFKEGLTTEEELAHFNNNLSDAQKTNKKYTEIDKKYNKETEVEPYSNFDCNKNFNNVGTKDNGANNMVNKMCEVNNENIAENNLKVEIEDDRIDDNDKIM